MVKKRKSRFSGKLTGLLTISMLGLMSASVSADSGVFDYGNLFGTEEISDLEKQASELAEEYDMNILLLTTEDANGMSSAEFAEDFYESHAYADNDAKGGIVLLIDMDNRELNLVTYDDMIYYITDAREEDIYDAGFDEVSDGEYGDSMQEMMDELEDFMEAGIPDNQYTYDVKTGKVVRYKSLGGGEIVIALVVALLCSGISCLILYRKYSVVDDFDYSVSENADMKLLQKEDQLIDKIVTKRRKPKPQSNGGGGGGSGRTSVHTSSGGRSVGGGHGRKF